MSFGVTPQGFARKRLPELIVELEAAAKLTFGSSVVVSPQSPMGQTIGLFADLLATVWETAEDTYQSYDPDQAEGVRLDMLARLRIFARVTNETDESFRSAITNAGQARTDTSDVIRAVREIEGVTYSHLFINDTGTIDQNGIESHSVAVAVIGGSDNTIAAILRSYVVPGVGSHGNRRVDTTIDGVCRSTYIVRPVEVPVQLSLVVRTRYDRLGCPPPSPSAIASGLAEDLVGANRLLNGEDVDAYPLRSRIEGRSPTVEFVSGTAGYVNGPLTAFPLPIGFFEIASIDVNNILITVIPG